MSSYETIQSQVLCDYKVCRNIVITQKGGMQYVRRLARDHYGWVVVDGKDYCTDHAAAAEREYLEKVARDAE